MQSAMCAAKTTNTDVNEKDSHVHRFKVGLIVKLEWRKTILELDFKNNLADGALMDEGPATTIDTSYDRETTIRYTVKRLLLSLADCSEWYFFVLRL